MHSGGVAVLVTLPNLALGQKEKCQPSLSPSLALTLRALHCIFRLLLFLKTPRHSDANSAKLNFIFRVLGFPV